MVMETFNKSTDSFSILSSAYNDWSVSDIGRTTTNQVRAFALRLSSAQQIGLQKHRFGVKHTLSNLSSISSFTFP
jgi:phage-related minor tail protein